MKTKVTVSLEKAMAYIGEQMYWWEDDGGEERKWYRDSKKYVVDDEGKKHRVNMDEMQVEIDADEVEPARVRVTKPNRLKLLNDAVDRAEAKKERKRAIDEPEAIVQTIERADSQEDDWSEEDLDTGEDSTVQEKGLGDRRKRGTKSSVNVKFKSVTSDHDFDFQVAPSKKKAGLYNVAIYKRQRLLAYVEVAGQTIVDFSHRLQELELDAANR